MKSLFSSPLGLLVVTFSSIFCQHAYASAAFPVNVDDLDPLKSCKRRDVMLMESDNKVYMYGGQSWVKNGTEEPFQITNHYLRVADFTKARDLSDPAILTAKDIPGNITIFQYGAFWADSQKIYIVGGSVNDEPWLSRDGEFLPSNYSAFKGSTIFSYEIATDRWNSEPAVQPNSGSGVTDSFCCGSFAYNAGAGKAYFFSGTNGAGARSLDPGSTPIYVGVTNEEVFGNGNLLTFETSSFKWANVTTDKQLTTTGTEGGQMVYLPGTETSSGGIAVLLGGKRRDTQDFESMRKVLVFDSATGSWYGQATTADGDYPSGRYNFCAVGASAADNSSHNIYVYAGESSTSTPQAYSDMWILSVPSFRWIRVDADSPARKSQGCTTVADRYMVTYGGVPSGWGAEGDADDCDQENYGIRLFDMTNLSWTTKYEGPSSAKNAFALPKAVYDVVGGNEKGGATKTAPSAGFETPGLASLFQKSNPTSSTGSSQPTDNGGTNPNPPKKSSNLGPILGGVLGGLAGLALILVGVLLLLKKRKTKHAYMPTEMAAPYSPDPRELPANGQEQKRVHEVYAGEAIPPQEMDAGPTSSLPQKTAYLRQ